MRTGIFYISVPNWGKHNPRADREHFSWFKFDNQYHLHMRVRRGYSAIATNLLPLLFQECSRANAISKPFAFRVELGVTMLGYSAKQITEALNELAKGRDESGGEIVLDRASSALQDSSSAKTTETTETTAQPGAPPLDFGSLYSKYPRKEGKTRGLAICKVQITTPEDFAALSLAIDRYGEHCRKSVKEAKYIKHFSSFMTCWRDWLEPDAGEAKPPSRPLNPFQQGLLDSKRGSA